MTSLHVHTHYTVLGNCCRRNLKLFGHYAYAIWLPDLGNMLLVGFASFEQAAG
jgi:hypothetical protein